MSDYTPENMKRAEARLAARMARNRVRLDGLVDGAKPSKAQQLAPELPFDEIWTAEPEGQLVIPGWGIGPGPAHLVTGTWYTGKTLLLATMGLCVAAGRRLFDLWEVRQGKWIHFDHEMGRRQLKRYVQRLSKGLGIEPEHVRGNMSLRVLPQLNLMTRGAMEHYTELLTGCSLATFDPLRNAAPGADENKSEFRQYIDLLSAVGDRTGCAIVILHHGGKPVEGAERKNTGRGTSAIDDAVQSKFVLSAQAKGEPMLVSHEKSRELDGTLTDFYLEFVNTTDSVRLAHRCPEEIAQVSSRKDDSARHRSLQRIGECFKEHGGKLALSVNGIRALTRMSNNAFYEAWHLGVAEGAVTRSGGPQAPVWSWSSR
jgi:hypothetical protein